MTEHNNHTQLSDSRIKNSIIHTPGVFSGLLMKSVRLLVKRLHRQHLITAGKDQCLSRICTTIFSPFLSLSQFASCRGCSSLFVIESGRVWQIYGLSSGKFGTTQGTARYTDCFPLLPLFLQRNPNEKNLHALYGHLQLDRRRLFGGCVISLFLLLPFLRIVWHLLTHHQFFLFFMSVGLSTCIFCKLVYTRIRWLNWALRGDEAAYCVSMG